MRELHALILLAVLSVGCGKCKFISPSTSLRSTSYETAGRDVEIVFSNPGDGDFDIYWVDPSMREVNMGKLDSWSELGYITKEGMAWRMKLFGTSLVVMEYLIHQPLDEPLIMNSDHQPLLALTVGEGCTNDDKDFLVPDDLKDPLKLFRSDKKVFPPRKRSRGEELHSFEGAVEVEVTFSADSVFTSEASPSELVKAGECADSELWLNRHVGAEGYHVLCVTSPPQRETLQHPHAPGITYEVQGWREGHESVPDNQTYSASTFSEFRSQLEELFSIQRTDDWRVKSIEAIRRGDIQSDGSSKWGFLPQPWRLFDVHRQPVTDLEGVAAGQVLLLFEGGQFMFPGVDLNFRREVAVTESGGESSKYLLTTLSMRPLLLQVDHLLRPEECELMTAHSRPLMVPSDVSLMDKDKGKAATNFRTSQYVFMASRDHATLRTIDSRIANLTGLDVLQQEDAQILKYEQGNYYLSHNDFWNPSFYQTPDMVAMTHAGHKNRLATVLWYMNSDLEGGCTSFKHAPLHNEYASQSTHHSPHPPSGTQKSPDPEVQDMLDCAYGLKVAPQKGRALLFYSLLPSGNGDAYSEHAACAVTKGTKWAANKWIWNQVR